ncbi:pancreatic triacylglycerol lipase-like [Plakobranchus ocellatus]|uniref:Pancreatic triacylglycerol lipase-like n=1 Tax=Plakobranchus ocellatus TaxID=259542 RepID=A0AAV3ZPX5_9GAST|nr:pancreatic triacylglycerol lipase-like [Plakobranchus ocellatus]
MLSPGKSYTYAVGVPSDVGPVQAVELSWHHKAPLSNPLKWNVLGLRRPEITVDEVDVFREEGQVDVHLCASSKSLETDHTLQINVPC